VGASLAVALQGSGLDVLTLDAGAPETRARDARSLALSWASSLILDRIGAWSRCVPRTEIRTIHVSQRGGPGRTVLDTRDVGLPALGFVISFADLRDALLRRLDETDANVHYQATVTGLEQSDACVVVRFGRGGRSHEVSAQMLVIADGGGRLAQMAGARTRVRDYAQAAVVANVRCNHPHGNRAFERFAAEGPVALLPHGTDYALVWSTRPARADELLKLDDRSFLEQLQAHFGDRAGRFLEASARSAFPLALRVTSIPEHARVLLLGNAAQMLHPIAGQGFNLGLRDAWTLAEVIHHRQTNALAACGARFRTSRHTDRAAGVAATDALATLFSNDLPPVRAARGAGLFLLDLFPAARSALMRRMIFGS
jgi:2-octaprenyl-6-methoxyphenol hydroxylase